MCKRVKPTNELRAATHEAQASDYKRLALYVTEAIINKRRDVVLKLPYFVTFDESFPKGVLIKKDARYNWYKAKAFKLADWLHKNGHMPEDAKGTMKSMRSVNNMLGEIDRMFANPQQEFLRNTKNVVDSENPLQYNAKLEDKETK